MEKTPDEIKKGLEKCSDSPLCVECPYYPDDDCQQLEFEALTYIRQLEAQIPKWISVEERLPNENEYVLILADSIQVARIIKGISEEERTMMRNGEIEDPGVWCWDGTRGHHLVPRSKLYGAADVHGNNKVPYSWKAHGGPMEWFGQEVSHWMPLPEWPKEG